MLDELMEKYGTDKNSVHSYAPVYHAMFAENRDSISNVLEIGILKGASLKVWRDYFPNATIVGFDKNDAPYHNEPRIQTYKVDTTKTNEIYKLFKYLPEQFDIIIDDGSHKIEHQLIAFMTLWQRLRTWGVYVIEDIVESQHDTIFRAFDNCTFKDRRSLKGRSDDALAIFQKRG